MPNIYKKDYLLLVPIVIISIILRIITAKSMGWLTDEIFYIDFLDKWMLEHFWQYVFQFRHDIYPPMSPEFGNGIIGLWSILPGMYISDKIGAGFLIGARMMNVMLGTINIILVYIICRKFYNKNIGIISSWLVATSPAIIAIDASAYLDTILSFLILIDIYFLFNFLKGRESVDLYILGIILGIMSISKPSMIPIIIITLFILLLDRFKRRDISIWKYLKTLLIFILVPITLWAGVRDIDHVIRTYNIINKETFIGTIGIIHDTGYMYYPIMIIGRLPSVIAIFLVISLILIMYDIFLDRRYIIKFDNFDMNKRIILSIMIFVSIMFISMGIAKTTIHRIIFVLPLLFILMSDQISRLPNLSKNKSIQNISHIFILTSLIIGTIIPLISWNPKYYNAYNNDIIGGLNGSANYYRTGDGEGMDEIGKWIMNNTQYGTQISVIGFDWVLKKYVNNRTIVPHFTQEKLKVAIIRGSDYIVIHRSYISNKKQLPVIEELSKYDPVYVSYVKGIPYIQIYKISTENRSRNFIYLKDKLENNILELKTLNNSTINVTPTYDGLIINYTLKNRGDYAYVLWNYRTEEKDMIVNIFGDANEENFYIDLLDIQRGEYFRYSKMIGWNGWKELYIPYNRFIISNENLSIMDIDAIKIGIDNPKREVINGSIIIK